MGYVLNVGLHRNISRPQGSMSQDNACATRIERARKGFFSVMPTVQKDAARMALLEEPARVLRDCIYRLHKCFV